MPSDTELSKNPWDMPVHSSNKVTTLDLENSLAQQKPKPSKDVPWYQKEIKALAPETRDFLASYTGIKDEEQLKKLIYGVRDMAWGVCPYHCIGLFRFLDFSIHLSPIYPSIVRHVRDEGAVFLDLGCCLGQDIRRLAHDAGINRDHPSKHFAPVQLFGAELFVDFITAGYELLGDRETLPARMFQADVLAPDTDTNRDDPLAGLYGKVDIIYLGSFLHQFDAGEQRVIVRKIGRLLRADGRGAVFGRHLGVAGRDKGGEYEPKDAGWSLYRHDQETIRRLFEQEEGSCMVSSELMAYKSKNWEDEWDGKGKGKPGKDTVQMSFVAVREAV